MVKKYDIIGETASIYINNLEEVNEWKSKIKELKSNGYLVVTKVSAPSKNRVKMYRYIAIKQKFSKGGEAGKKSIKKPIRKKPQPKTVRQYFEDRPYSYAGGGIVQDSWRKSGEGNLSIAETKKLLKNMPKD